MFGAAAFTSSRRLREIPRPILAAGGAIALGAATGLIPLFATGAFELTPRELIPIGGILIGGAMAATSLTGRRLLDDVQAGVPLIETRLALGAPVQVALRPLVRRAVRGGLIPVLDQTKNVGLVTRRAPSSGWSSEARIPPRPPGCSSPCCLRCSVSSSWPRSPAPSSSRARASAPASGWPSRVGSMSLRRSAPRPPQARRRAR
jgi:hypothetical protein